MIVKVQRSLESSDGVERILVYNRTRSVEWQEELTKQARALFKAGEFKHFRYAHLSRKKKIVLGARAPKQRW